MARKPAKFRRKKRKSFRTKTQSKVPRPLAEPGVYRFKRTIAETLLLSNTSPPSGWTSTANNLGKVFGWTLSSVNDHSDFENLFKYYRIKAARVRMYMSNTSSVVDDASHVPNNGQILCTIDLNQDGTNAPVATESLYLDSQTAKRKTLLRNDGKPSLDEYMRLKQLTEVRSIPATTTTTVQMQSPKWVSTTQNSVPHFGYNMMLQRVDGQGFSSGLSTNQVCKMFTTLYFECKKVL